jgi:hypothetical protein
MINLHHYGLHFASGVGFLMQKGSHQSLYKGLTPPFKMVGHPRCPHDVRLEAAGKQHLDLLKDPLIHWMANPRGVAILAEADLGYVEQLTQMYNPTESLMALGWGNRTWNRHVWSTNLAPWVLADASSRDMKVLNIVRHGGAPRPLLCLAREPLPGIVLTSKYPTLPSVPELQALGAWCVKERLKTNG